LYQVFVSCWPGAQAECFLDITAQPAAQLTASVGILRALCVLQAITRKTRILDVSYNASNNELVRNSNGSMQQQQHAETACNSSMEQHEHHTAVCSCSNSKAMAWPCTVDWLPGWVDGFDGSAGWYCMERVVRILVQFYELQQCYVGQVAQ
jgi:hypothetical protein